MKRRNFMPLPSVRNLAEAGKSSEAQGSAAFVGNLKRFATASEGGTMSVGEGNTRSVSATGTSPITDANILLTGTGTYAWNLPSAAGVAGLVIRFVKTGASGVVTLTPAGSETINGAATLAVTAQWRSIALMSDGTNWVMLYDATPVAG
jgi:hypothetical protein